MKGVVSTGLMLVATSAEGVKIPLAPPESSPIGTRVTIPNFPGDVAPAGTNLKKLWERIGDKFSTDASCAAMLEGGGVLTTPQGIFFQMLLLLLLFLLLLLLLLLFELLGTILLASR
jgi:hypothetical protein